MLQRTAANSRLPWLQLHQQRHQAHAQLLPQQRSKRVRGSLEEG
jgi:hypothetical protein